MKTAAVGTDAGAANAVDGLDPGDELARERCPEDRGREDRARRLAIPETERTLERELEESLDQAGSLLDLEGKRALG